MKIAFVKLDKILLNDFDESVNPRKYFYWYLILLYFLSGGGFYGNPLLGGYGYPSPVSPFTFSKFSLNVRLNKKYRLLLCKEKVKIKLLEGAGGGGLGINCL